MTIERISFRFIALLLAATLLSACAPVPPQEAAITADISSSNWKANRVFAHNIAFEQPAKKNRFSNSLEIALRNNVGWFSASPSAEYRLTYQLLAEQAPKQFNSGSEGRLSVRYILKDRSQTEVMNKVISTSGKLGSLQSLSGAEGVAKVVEAYANDNLKELFAELGKVGASLYDQQQAQLSEQKTIEYFSNYDIFSDVSIFERRPYSTLTYSARIKLVKNTKPMWFKKLRAASADNCQKFLSTYDSYIEPDDVKEIKAVIHQKRTHPSEVADKPPVNQAKRAPDQAKPPMVEHKNPF